MVDNCKCKIFLFLVLCVIIIDQFCKYLIYCNLNRFDVSNIGFMFVYLCYVPNDGLAFSFLSDCRYIKIFIVISRVIIIYYLLKMLFWKNISRFDIYNIVGVGFMCGGGISNTIDLFTYGHVVDMFYFRFCDISEFLSKNFSIISFNFADIFVIIGIVISTIYSLKMWELSRMFDKKFD